MVDQFSNLYVKWLCPRLIFKTDFYSCKFIVQQVVYTIGADQPPLIFKQLLDFPCITTSTQTEAEGKLHVSSRLKGAWEEHIMYFNISVGVRLQFFTKDQCMYMSIGYVGFGTSGVSHNYKFNVFRMYTHVCTCVTLYSIPHTF